MSLHLYLLRHAKAKPGSISQQDFDRELAPRGIEDASNLRRYFAQQGVNFDHIWCSSAVRTCETLEQLDIKSPAPVMTRDLYHASSDKMLAMLRQTPADAKTVLMVGHNPGISQLAASFASAGDEQLISQVYMNYPTCACSVFTFDCDTWQEAGPDNSEIIDYWTRHSASLVA